MDFKSMLIGGLGTALLVVSMGATSNTSENKTPITFDESMIITLEDLGKYESYRLGGATSVGGRIYQVVEIESKVTLDEFVVPYEFRLIQCNELAR